MSSDIKNKIFDFKKEIEKEHSIEALKGYYSKIDTILNDIPKNKRPARKSRFFIKGLIINEFINAKQINEEICKNICISYCLYEKITLYDLVCLFLQNNVAKDRITNILKSIDENTGINWGNKLYIWIMLNQKKPIEDILQNNVSAEKQITNLVSNNNALSLAVKYNVDTNILEYLVSKINDNDKSKWLNHMYTSYHRYNTLLDIANSHLIELDIVTSHLIKCLTNNNALTSKQLYGKVNGIIKNEEDEDAYEKKYREIFPSYEYNGNIIKPSPFLLACLYEFTADIEKFINIDPEKYGNAEINYEYGGIVKSITIIDLILREPQLSISFKTIIAKWSVLLNTWEKNKKIIKDTIIIKFEEVTEIFFEWDDNGDKSTAIKTDILFEWDDDDEKSTAIKKTYKKYIDNNFKNIIAIAAQYNIINEDDNKIFINGSDNEHTDLSNDDKKKWKQVINEYLPDSLKIEIIESTGARYTQYLYKNQ